MAIFVHVVGEHGVGKSTLIKALAAQYKAVGKVCAGDGEPFIFTNRADALREQPGADVYFIEHLAMRTVDAFPGELVIQMHRAPVMSDEGVRQQHCGQMAQAGHEAPHG